MPHGKPFKSLIPPDWPLDVQPTDETGEIDLSLIEYNLSLTPAERLEQNDRFIQFVEIARAAGRKLGYGTNDGTSEALT